MATCSRNGLIAVTAEYQKSAWKLVLLMCTSSASRHGGTVTIQRGWGCGAEAFKKVLVTQFDISHIFISTEKTCKMFQFHNFPLIWSSVHLYMMLPLINWTMWSCAKLALQWYSRLWWLRGVYHPLECSLSDRRYGSVQIRAAKSVSCTFKRMCWSRFCVAASLTDLLAVFVTHLTSSSTCCFSVIRFFSQRNTSISG